MIATPSYDGKVKVEYMQSILDYLFSTKLNVSYSVYPNESLVSRARNKLFNQFYYDMNEKNLTHILWQDSDVAATGYGLDRIVSLNLDVVGMAIPLKTDPCEVGILTATTAVTEEVSEFLYKTEYLGCGLMMLSRDAVIDIVSYCEQNNLWYWDFASERKEYDVFRIGSNENNFYESEDWYICSLLKKIGYDIYVDSGSDVSHNGYHRPACPINPEAIAMNYSNELSYELRSKYWCPNDSNLPKSMFIKEN